MVELELAVACNRDAVARQSDADWLGGSLAENVLNPNQKLSSDASVSYSYTALLHIK